MQGNNYTMLTGICFLFIATCCLWATDGAVTKKKEEYIPIKYPGPIQDVSTRYGSTQDTDIPEECKNKTYCTIKPPDYPQERFNQMFKGTKPLSQPTLIIEDFDNRQGDPEEVDNCETEVTFEPLYKVRSKRGNWHTVVQAPEENYLQLVRIETCKDTGGSCFTAFGEIPNISTFCKQKYNHWEFLVEAENNTTTKVETDLPVCCSCHYKTVTSAGRK